MAYRRSILGKGNIDADVAAIRARLFQVPAPSSGAGTEHSVIAGAGLTGGGQLTADVTLDVGAGNGITVSANSIAVNQGYAFAWTAAQTWAAGATFNAGLTVNSAVATFNFGAEIAAGKALTFGGDVALSRKAADILQLASGDNLESYDYASGVSGWHIGQDLAEFSNVVARGEFRASVFKYSEITATAGTFGVWPSASTIAEDYITTPASVGSSFTIRAKNNDVGGMLFAVGDILRIKAWNGSAIGDAWATVTNRSNQTTYTIYTCTLSYGSTNTMFYKGTAIEDYGPSGSGYIALSADGAIGASANMTIATHAGSPWSAQTLMVRLGNMNGSYGTGANNRYGIGIGDYASGNYLSYNAETADAFLLSAGDGNLSIDEDGLYLAHGTSNFNKIRWLDGTTDVGTFSTYSPGSGEYQVIFQMPYSGGARNSFYVDLAESSGTGAAAGWMEFSNANGLQTNKAFWGAGAFLEQGAADTSIITLGSTDVDHGMTDVAEEQIFSFTKKYSATAGGVNFAGLTEDIVGVQIVGYVTTESATRSTSPGIAPIALVAYKKNGTSAADLAADKNLVNIRNGSQTKFIFDSDGDAHADSAWTTFDDDDDIETLNLLTAHMQGESDPLKEKFKDYKAKDRGVLERKKLAKFNDDGGRFINHTKVEQLHTGAIRQVAEQAKEDRGRIATLEAALKAAGIKIPE